MSFFRTAEHFADFILEWLLPKLPGLLILLALSLACFAIFRRPAVTRSVPEASCVDTATGRTQEEHYTTMQCYGYDKDSNCIVNVPVDNTITRQEVSVACNYTEWR